MRSLPVVGAVVALVAGLLTATAAPTLADDTTVSYDTLRTGWDPNEASLNSATLQESDYGQLFATQLDGQVYAQPIVVNGTLLVETENDKVYGLDPVSGTIRWTRDVGPFWPASAIGCGDLVPNIGITGTPVYDSSTNTAYLTAKVNDGPDEQHPHWYLHAIDATTGAERANFPVAIQGSPSNSPGHPFNPFTAMQRPGLLLLDGHIYAGFASHCDYGPYVGYVIGWDKTTGAQTAMWSTEADSDDGEAGIWQGGGGLVSDGPGQIIVATGNGVSPVPGPGTSPPGQLAESVVRLKVNSDNSLAAVDFFSPVNNTNLDRDDADLGSGGPLAIPDGYGTAAHPHLLVEDGKDGRVFLLDRDNLGGVGQGPGGVDAPLQTGGPYNGVWGHPAFWGGDSGYVYIIENGGPLRVYQVGVNGSGVPALTAIGASPSTWGYTSGSPVVTSNGTAAGSALVWAVYSSGSDGSNGQLRAYAAVPGANGTLPLKYSAPIGHASKFAVPGTDAGRVYVGNRDGKIFGFGRPVEGALNGTPTDFGNVAVNHTRNATAHVTATRDVTISAITTSAPFGVTPPSLPVSLHAGDSLAIPVSFSPTTPGAQSGALSLTTDDGNFAFDLHGTATRPGLSATPSSLSFGDVPVRAQVTQNVNITNTSTVTETVSSVTPPTAPFSTSGLPAEGSTIAPGASVSVPITFAPGRTATFNRSFRIATDTGSVHVPLTGTGVAGAPHLTITPTSLAYGSAPIGTSVTKSFDIENTGNLLLTITKAAPPAGEFGTSTPVSEGQQLAPGQVIHQSVTFTPTVTGAASGSYLITGNDGQGEQTVSFTGRGTPALVPIAAPVSGTWQLNGSATQNDADTVLTDTGGNEAGSAVSPTPINPVGVHVTFTAQISGGSGADGLTFALLDGAASSPNSLGDSGGALGFDGLTGVAVTLDTYQNGGDPSTNFTGIGTSDGAGVGQVRYTTTRRVPTSLRSGTHSVDVTVSASGLHVIVDGSLSYSAAVPIPATAYLAFTAGTGGLTDVHTIRDVTITRPPATGAVLGTANLCLTTGTATGGHAPATASTCGSPGVPAAQKWVVQGDGTLTNGSRCLSVVGGARTNTSPVEVAACTGTPVQVWTAQPDGTLRNEQSGRCLAAPSSASGVQLQIRNCNASVTRQLWTLPA